MEQKQEKFLALIAALQADGLDFLSEKLTLEHHHGSLSIGSISNEHARFFFSDYWWGRYLTYIVFAPLFNLPCSTTLLRETGGRYFFGLSLADLSDELLIDLTQKVKAVLDKTPFDQVKAATDSKLQESESDTDDAQCEDLDPTAADDICVKTISDKQVVSQTPYLERLPNDLFIHLFGFLEDHKVLNVFSSVSKYYQALVSSYFLSHGFALYQTRFDPSKYFQLLKTQQKYTLTFDEKSLLQGDQRLPDYPGYFDDTRTLYLTRKRAGDALSSGSSWYKDRERYGYVQLRLPLDEIRQLTPDETPRGRVKCLKLLADKTLVSIGAYAAALCVPMNNYHWSPFLLKIDNPIKYQNSSSQADQKQLEINAPKGGKQDSSQLDVASEQEQPRRRLWINESDNQMSAKINPAQDQQGSTSPTPGLFQPVAQTTGAPQAVSQAVVSTRGQMREEKNNECCVMQ